MKPVAFLLVGAGLGALITLVCTWPSGGDAAPPVRADAPGPAPAPNPAAGAELQRVEHAVAQLAAKVDALDRRIATALERMTERSVAAGPATSAGGLAVDEATMQRALEGALEGAAQRQLRDKYGKLTPEAMLAEVERLQYQGKDPLAARQALDVLLARELSPEQRAKALVQLGILQRSSKETAAAETTLRDVMQTQGTNSETGSAAAYQLIWTVWERDRREALGIADGLARDAQNEGTRIHARWSAAMLAHELDDVARARADYAAILRDCGTRPEFAGIAKDVQVRLKGLDGR